MIITKKMIEDLKTILWRTKHMSTDVKIIFEGNDFKTPKIYFVNYYKCTAFQFAKKVVSKMIPVEITRLSSGYFISIPISNCDIKDFAEAFCDAQTKERVLNEFKKLSYLTQQNNESV